MAEQLICNQQVAGSIPVTSSSRVSVSAALLSAGEFPSGQRGQTVNLLSTTSMVRIRPPPPKQERPSSAMATRSFFLRCIIADIYDIL